MIVTRFSHLIKAYHGLGAGDVFVGRVPTSHLKSTLLTDLSDRGVRLLPSATAQLLNGSKVAQAFVLAPWMVPHTRPITRRQELLEAIVLYQELGIDTVVTKMDRLHCGHGVCYWDHLETLYGCLLHQQSAFPFVLQPYLSEFTDVRIIMVGDFYEAYSRHHPHNFRANRSVGGQSRPFQLLPEQIAVCRQVLERAQMPYAHIDLMLSGDGAIYLSELRLNGGIRGARIDQRTLKQMKKEHLMQLAHQVVAPHQETERSKTAQA